jgi:predicted PurR-regulated permease PerM
MNAATSIAATSHDGTARAHSAVPDARLPTAPPTGGTRVIAPRLARSRQQTALVVIAVILVTAGLYRVKAVAVPIALAILIAFVLAPLVAALEHRRVPSAIAVVLVVVLTFSALGVLGWMITAQLVGLAQDLPRYRGNILNRIDVLHVVHQTKAVENIERIARDVAQGMKPSAPGGKTTDAVPVTVEPPSVLWQLPSVLPSLAAGGFTTVLVIFMLLRRRDLHARIIQLVGEHRLALTTKALDEIGQRITRYLVRQSLLNAAFGAAVAGGLLVLGVPYALVWGALAGTLRFIPYIGPLAAGLAPVLVSLAVFPGWLKPILVVAWLSGLEIAINAGIEPWLYGRGLGLSEVALLVAIGFWTWLWGPIGLLLATPVTVCLAVLSKYVPGLRGLAVLIGAEVEASPADLYYHRIVARDERDALGIARAYATEHSPGELAEHVLLRALKSAARDRERRALGDEDMSFVLDATRRVLDALVESGAFPGGDVSATAGAAESGTTGAPARWQIVACPARDEADEVALSLLAALLDPGRVETAVVPHRLLLSETLELIERERPALVCLGTLGPGGLATARYLVKRLRGRFPDLPIVVGRWGGQSPTVWRDQLTSVKPECVVTTLEAARTAITMALGLTADGQARQYDGTQLRPTTSAGIVL